MTACVLAAGLTPASASPIESPEAAALRAAEEAFAAAATRREGDGLRAEVRLEKGEEPAVIRFTRVPRTLAGDASLSYGRCGFSPHLGGSPPSREVDG